MGRLNEQQFRGVSAFDHDVAPEWETATVEKRDNGEQVAKNYAAKAARCEALAATKTRKDQREVRRILLANAADYRRAPRSSL